MSLKDKRCVPCEGGTPPLDELTTRKLLGQVSGWAVAQEAEQPRLRKRFEFVDFLAAMAFVDKMAAVAEEEAAPSRLLRPLQPRGRHAVDPRRRRALRERLHPRGQDRRDPRVTQGGVVIAGATGLMGTALAASCARDGIAVSALVRDTARAAQRLPVGEAARLGRDARHRRPRRPSTAPTSSST